MIDARPYSVLGDCDEAVRRAHIERGIYMGQLFRRVFAGFGRRAARKPAAEAPADRSRVIQSYWI